MLALSREYNTVTVKSVVPNELVKTMSDLKASDFADGVTAGAAGLEPPVLTVTVTLKTGKGSREYQISEVRFDPQL